MSVPISATPATRNAASTSTRGVLLVGKRRADGSRIYLAPHAALKMLHKGEARRTADGRGIELVPEGSAAVTATGYDRIRRTMTPRERKHIPLLMDSSLVATGRQPAASTQRAEAVKAAIERLRAMAKPSVVRRRGGR